MENFVTFFQNNTVLTGLMGFIGGITGVATLGYTIYFNRKDRPKLAASVSSIKLNKPNSQFLGSSNIVDLSIRVVNTGKREASLIGAELYIKEVTDKDGKKFKYKEKCPTTASTAYINKVHEPGKARFIDSSYGFGSKELGRCLHFKGKLLLEFVNHKNIKLKIVSP